MILVSTDGSELSDKAVMTGAKLAKQLGTEMLVITVVKAKGAEHAVKALEEAKEIAEKVGAKCEAEEVIASNTIPEAILKTAQEKHVRFIVMASRGLGTLGSLFIGSTTQQVLAKADRPVLVVR